MKLKKLNSKKSKAQAMVEFAIALPVLLALLYGILEAGRLLFLYSTVTNASRQAVRWGSANGVGNGTEPRYQDCDGIRNSAKGAAFMGPFADGDITIKWDTGPGSSKTTFCAAGATADTSFVPANGSRITVEVKKQFVPVVPKLLPFIARVITSSSSRTIIGSIEILPNVTRTFTPTKTATPTSTLTPTPTCRA